MDAEAHALKNANRALLVERSLNPVERQCYVWQVLPWDLLIDKLVKTGEPRGFSSCKLMVSMNPGGMVA